MKMQFSPLRSFLATRPVIRPVRKRLFAAVATVALWGVFAGSPPDARAATIYASAAGNGLPLKTAVESATAGDTVIVRADGTYVEGSPITVPPGITIQGEGSGASRPLITAADTFGATIQQDFDIYSFGSIDGVHNYLFVYEKNVAALKGIFNIANANGNIWSNLIIDGRRFTTGNTNRDKAVAAGIIMENNSGAPSQVTGCDFLDIRGGAVFSRNGSNYDFSNNYFYNCGFDECAFAGGAGADASSGEIIVKDSTGVKIHGNQFKSDHIGVGQDGGYQCGYGVKHVSGSIEVYDNNFDMCETQAYLNTSSNFDMEFGGEAFIHNNSFGAVVSALSGLSTGTIYANDFRYRNGYNYGIEANASNLIIDSNTYSGSPAFIRTFGTNQPTNLTISRNIIKGGGALLTLTDKIDALNVLNNTVYLNGFEVTGGNNSGKNATFINGTKGGNDWEIKNNIIVATNANTPLISYGTGIAPTAVQVNNNLLNNVSAGSFGSVGTNGNITGAPNLDANYLPQTGSIVINAGTDITPSLPTTYGYFAAHPMNFAAQADIGARETDNLGGSGSGLTAKYYNGTNLNTLLKTQTDPRVDFQWGTGAPAIGSINADSFSVSWTGQVQAVEAGTYTFTTTTDDGARLWLNDLSGTPLIDKWVPQGTTSWSTTYPLAANQKVNIRMDYFESGGGATARLFWRRPGQSADQIIPQSQLFPTTGAVILVNRAVTPGGGAVTARGEYTVNGEIAVNAFDGTPDTKWIDTSNSTWIQYAFPGAGYAVQKYSITSANDDLGRDPKNWVLKGSNSSTPDWTSATVLDQQTGIDWTSAERKTKKIFTVSSPATYKTYRLEITANEGSTGKTQLSEIELLAP